MKYTVQRGDNLWTLARQHGISLQDLLRQVPESVRRDPRTLQPGMTLTLPGADKTAPTASQAPSRGMNTGYPDYMVPGRNVGGGMMTIPERDRSIPQPYDPGVQNRPAPSTLERLYKEAPEQVMKMLQGMPPTQMVGGAARAVGSLSRGNLLERIGTPIARPFEQMGKKYDEWRAGRNAVRQERQNIDDALSGGMDRTPMQYEELLPGQRQVQRMVDNGSGADIPLQPDVGSMYRNNPNMSLESLHRFMSPGQPMPSAGTSIRPNPMRMSNMPTSEAPMIGRGQPMYGGQLRR